MALSYSDKYGFPIKWFVDKHFDTNFDKKTCQFIDKKYREHYLDYTKFINEISTVLSISSSDISKYLEVEHSCRLCNKYYPYSFEKFTKFIDYDSKKDLTEEICYNCVYSKYNCNKCKKKLNYEPYGIVYIDNITKLGLCKECI